MGSINSSQAKYDVCDLVGLDYLEYVVEHGQRPFVVIGGIKQNNIDAIIERSAKTICLVTEIMGADDIVRWYET